MNPAKRSSTMLIALVFCLFLSPLGTVSAQIEGLEMAEPPTGPTGGHAPTTNEASATDQAPSQIEPASSRQGPPPARVELIPPAGEAVGFDEEGLANLTVRYIFPSGYHQTKQEEMLTVSLPESAPAAVAEINYPEGVKEEGLVNYYDSVELDISLEAKAGIRPGDYRSPLTVSYQLCDEAGTCFFPQDVTKEVFLQIPESSSAVDSDGIGPASRAGGATTGPETSLLTILQYLLFAFVGGILLNVMPCVLPVLSIRALNLVKQSKNDRREIFFGSLLYSAGILLSLIVLAAVVTVLKLSGELVGWGFQFQNPGFVVFLIAVVFVFALSLFDVYVFQAPAMSGTVQKAGEKGYLGSFFNGIIAVLLATPCTAPLLGTALGFAFSQSPIIIFAMFSMVGLGFALPFLLIGIWPAAVQKLPKPGPWMNTFKELMGFVLLATVLYLMTILRHQISSEGILRVIFFLLLLGFFLWIYGKTAKPTTDRKRKWIILGIFIILTVSAADRILMFETAAEAPASTSIREGWEVFEPEKLESYRDAGKPVFVVFSAEWCTVCKMNEQTVLHTKTADELFEERNIEVLYGDFTNEDPLIEEWIRKYGRAGVPVYAYYPSKGNSHELLPEVLTQDTLKKRLR